MKKIELIEIWWHGPFTIEQISEKYKDESESYGLYQIYGTHNIYGPNSLLYIGKASQQTFAKRLSQHFWTNWEPSNVSFYIGQIGALKNVNDDEWVRQISVAEKILISHCTPSYNTQHINGYGDINNTVVLNFDKINRLPKEVSTLLDDSDWHSEKWKPFHT